MHILQFCTYIITSSMKKYWQYGAPFIKMRELVQSVFKEREQSMLPAVCCSLCHHWVNYNVCTASANKETFFIALVDGTSFCLLFSSFIVFHGQLMDLPIVGTELDSLNSSGTSMQQCLKMGHTHYWSLPPISVPCKQLLRWAISGHKFRARPVL